MIVTPVKTKLIQPGDDIYKIIQESIKSIEERSILVIASKAVSTCENRFIKKINASKQEKHNLVKKESELYLNPHSSKYEMMLTIKRNIVFVNAGIDESNANNQYILWPKDPQKSVDNIWRFLKKHYKIKNIGVTISDSSSFMLNWGVVGRAIAYCGFNPLRSYIGKPDLFNRKMKMEKTNIMQSITDAAVLEMGEGSEQTPMALITSIQNTIEFVDHVPTDQELKKLHINIEDDVYAPILKKAGWKKGGSYTKNLV